MLRVMNTLTHAIEPFETAQPGHVRMYVCGPSVYDESHLGHARSYVGYDAMKRYFLEKGLRVTHVQNFTDVEERIHERAKQAGMAPLDFATHLIGRFFEDMDALHVLRADHYPRVSEHVKEILGVVKDLLRSGAAYRGDCGTRGHLPFETCDVYFDVTKVRDYGALIGEDIEHLTVERPTEAGERRHPLDFALWKTRDDFGVTFASPWGPGRPGWHVECTAMATRYLGPDFDIHGGGIDLVFPHHESERAIGEAHLGTTYCRHYLHNGFVTVGDRKMSKSLGNFVTVKELLRRHDAEVLRTFLLSAHYRAPINYSEKAIGRAEARVAAWRTDVAATLLAAEGFGAGPLPAGMDAVRDRFHAALADDFRFDQALDALDEALALAATYKGNDAAAALVFLKEAARMTGLLWSLPA